MYAEMHNCGGGQLLDTWYFYFLYVINMKGKAGIIYSWNKNCMV